MTSISTSLRISVGRGSVPRRTPKVKQQRLRSVLGRVTTSHRLVVTRDRVRYMELVRVKSVVAPCLNYTSRGAKPADGLSSGSWLKIKRSKNLSHVGVLSTGARLNGSHSPHPITCKGIIPTMQ